MEIGRSRANVVFKFVCSGILPGSSTSFRRVAAGLSGLFMRIAEDKKQMDRKSLLLAELCNVISFLFNGK